MSTTSKDDRRRERWLSRMRLESSYQPLPPWALDLAPEPVRQASETHRVALLELAERQAQLRQAAAAVDAAAEADRAAAEEAVRTGKPVPAATLPVAIAAREGAGRGVPAATSAARASQVEYVRALLDHIDAFASAVDDAHAALYERGRPLLDELAQILERLVDLQRLERELDYARSGNCASIDVRPSLKVRRGGDPLRGALRDHLNGLLAELDAQRPADA